MYKMFITGFSSSPPKYGYNKFVFIISLFFTVGHKANYWNLELVCKTKNNECCDYM